MQKPILITHRLFLFFLLSLGFQVYSVAQNGDRIAEWLSSYRPAGAFTEVDLLSPAPARANLSDVLDNASVFQFNQPALQALVQEAPLTIRFLAPQPGGNKIALELVKVALTTADFSAAALSGDGDLSPLPAPEGVHYRGVVAGIPGSIACLSFFDREISGMLMMDDQTFILGPLEDDPEQLVLYETRDLKASLAHACYTDESLDFSQAPGGIEERGVGCKTVPIYFECDYKLYQDKGSSTTNTTNYVTALFNQVSTLYAAENIGVAISQIYVWTTPDPYMGYNSTSSVLTAFRSTRGTNFNGNLAHFLSTRSLGGGIAYLDVICLKQYAFGVSGITTSFQNVPTYSWSVEVVTHELGHNLGSWHTQSCNWPNGALDNCVSPEGNCSPGPPPNNGGTIMSYCHLSGYGINFNNGFGQIPGNHVRNKVSSASCLTPSGQIPGGLSSGSITANSATVSWGAVTGATGYTVQYKVASTNTWTTAPVTSATSLNLTGLTASTSYNWKVKTDCSDYSGTSNFTTIAGGGNGGGNGGGGNGGGGNGGICNAPTGLNSTNITTNSVKANWAASAGASNYTVQYKVSTAGAWITAGSTTLTSYTITGLSSATNYQWRVKANCSGYSNFVLFTTSSLGSGGGGGNACPAPTNTVNVAVNPTSAVISWAKMPAASNYTLQLLIGNSTAWYTLGTIKATMVTIIGLTPSTTYQWRVKANCSAYSAPVLLVTPANFSTPPSDEMPSIQSTGWTINPNPAQDQLNIQFDAPADQENRVVILDMNGRICLQQNLGEQSNRLQVQSLAKGVYIVQMWRGDAMIGVEKLVLQ